MTTMKTLIIADSRGAHLEDELRKGAGVSDVKVIACPGAGILESLEKTMCHILRGKPVVIMSGICDITQRNKHTKEVTLRWQVIRDSRAATDSIMTKIRHAHDRIREKSDTRISVATITGVDLTDINNRDRRQMTEREYRQYVQTHKTKHPNQDVLDNLITELNRKITAFNENNGTPTTWTAEVVHPYQRGRHRAYYGRLADGCHPGMETRRRWAHQIARTIKRCQHKAKANNQS